MARYTPKFCGSRRLGKPMRIPWDGSVFGCAVVLGDIDNDGLNEFVVGSTEGRLLIIKGLSAENNQEFEGLGTIVAVAVGDAQNTGKNVLLVATAEGTCFTFGSSSKGGNMELLAKQRVPVNIKSMLIVDVDGDEQKELLMSKTDRAVLAFRWTSQESKYVQVEKWPFPGQIGSISEIRGAGDNDRIVIGVSQPGGTFMTLDQSGTTAYAMGTSSLATSSALRRGVATEFLGGIRGKVPSVISQEREEGEVEAENKESTIKDTLYAVCAQTGSIGLHMHDVKLWDIDLEVSLCSFQRTDVTGDGCDEVIVCALNGQTYIVDTEGSYIHFDFGHHVCTFTAGSFGVDGKNCPCFVYVPMDGPITLYSRIKIRSLKPQRRR